MALVSINSCENEPYEGNIYVPEETDNTYIPEDFENSFFAKLNGTDFNVHQIYTTYSVEQDDDNFIAITGSENNYHAIIIYVPANISVGTYQYDTQTVVTVPNLNITYSNLSNLLESGIGNGTLTIDVHDIDNHYIKGNFECVVTSENGSINDITEGTFEVVYVP